MREVGRDRTVPVLVTLLVLAFVLMTVDIRSDGGGATGTLRAAVNTVLTPLQKAAAFVVSPIGAAIEAVGDLGDLRDERDALRAELAAANAELAAVDDKLQRLASLERMNHLELDVADLVTTNANVVGRLGGGDLAFKIDKGEESGVLVGHPVLDQYGYLVGRIVESWSGGAVVVPLVGDVASVTVDVGSQRGTLSPILGEDEMVLDVFETAVPVAAGDRVVTSPFSVTFPPSIPVGEIVADVDPQGQALTALVHPYTDTTRLRVVVVVAWPTASAPQTTGVPVDDGSLSPETPAGE